MESRVVEIQVGLAPTMFTFVRLTEDESRQEVEEFRREHGDWHSEEWELFSENDCRRAKRWYFELDEYDVRGGPYGSFEEATQGAKQFARRLANDGGAEPPYLDEGDECVDED